MGDDVGSASLSRVTGLALGSLRGPATLSGLCLQTSHSGDVTQAGPHRTRPVWRATCSGVTMQPVRGPRAGRA